MIADAIEDVTRPGETVLDLFAGAGATLMAAELTGRRAFLAERDPALCDLISALEGLYRRTRRAGVLRRPWPFAPGARQVSERSSYGGDYEIGFGRPPRRTQFKKGKSGNGRGRPRGARNTAALLADELKKTVCVTEGGRTRTISKRSAFVKSLVARAIKGDARAAAQLLKAIETLEDGRAAPMAPYAEGAGRGRGLRQAETPFPMSEEEWEAKFGPHATQDSALGDHERMSDAQMKRAIKVIHARVEALLEGEEDGQ